MNSQAEPQYASAVSAAYNVLAADGMFECDSAQIELAQRLDKVASALKAECMVAKSSSLGWVFARSRKPVGVRGLYIWGDVGRGKSMLMDLFFNHAPNKAKRRVHFHAFMQEIHERIAAYRKRFENGEEKHPDPMPPVAREISADAKLLCFDEFNVTDIADAMILGRLFAALFERRVTVVATSNIAPDRLYQDGLNRQLFVPFIKLIKAHADVYELTAATDYRLDRDGGIEVYFQPLGPRSDHAIDGAWRSLAGSRAGEPASIARKGRQIAIPEAAEGYARFGFEDICGQPFSAADYLAIAKKFHTVFVDHVPKMDRAKRNEAKRFVHLIDVLYDNCKRLIMSAAAPPDHLFTVKTGAEASEFRRATSRLFEMQSGDYLQQAAERVNAG